MASHVRSGLSKIPWRIVGWGAAVVLLALPFVAMQFTADVSWTASDFIAFGIMLLMVGVPLEMVARASSNWSYRGAAALALFAMFVTIWANLAVGIVGSQDNPANQLFLVALLIGLSGAAIARFRAGGMALAMLATALSLGVVFAIASSAPSDEPWATHSGEAIGTSFFAGMFFRWTVPESGAISLTRSAGSSEFPRPTTARQIRRQRRRGRSPRNSCQSGRS
jgi:hypothetical protein